MLNRLFIILIGIAFVGCKSQSVIGSDCFKYSNNVVNLKIVKEKEVKPYLPLTYKLGNKKIDGKVISCKYDTSKQIYILVLKNNVESYCIKASKT
jgi:hypothetical protein